MPSKIILKKSSVVAKAPVAGDLDFGELAINYADSKLYFKKADGSIDAFTSSAGSSAVTSVGGNVGDITDSQLLTSIKNVDGTGSGLDADLLDGNHASDFYLASNPNGYTNNTGDVTITGTQTLTNKTINRAVLNDGYTEEVFAITDGTTVNLDPNNGSIQTWTLGANCTPGQANWGSGQSITLMIDDGTARTITWTTLAPVWETNLGSAPTLALTGFTVIVLWKVGTTIYGARVGDA